jgi:short chain dehydrogenase
MRWPTVFALVSEITPEEIRRGTEVTYLGQVHRVMAALSQMRPRNRGTIINVGSALAYRAIPLQSYCAAKFVVRGFTDSLRSELIHENCAVNLVMVRLPAVNTPQFDWALNRTGQKTQPVPPIFQPEVPARAIVFAAENPSRREIWVGFSTAKAIVGNALMPGLLDRYLVKAGYNGQLTDEPKPRDAPANLFETVDREIRGAWALRRLRPRGLVGDVHQPSPQRSNGQSRQSALCRDGRIGTFCKQDTHWISKLGPAAAGQVSKGRAAGPLSSEFATGGEGADAVGGATGHRLDRQRRINAADGREHRAVANP